MLVVGMVAAVGITAATPASAATTESFSLSSASVPGQSTVGWQVGLGNPPATPNVWADPITLNGQIDSATGAISGATLSMPPVTQPPTQGETPTFTFTEVNPGTATGTYDATTGAVTLNDVFSLSFNIEPLGDTCVSTPINVALSGTYDSTTEDVTLATTSSFTIPQFPAGPNCLGAVAQGINASPGGVAGSVGNAMSLALNGQFAPGLPTTTTLAVSPTSPEPAGTSVMLTATVNDSSGAGTPAGKVNFLDNGAGIGTGTLSPGGTTGTAAAALTTSILPGGTNQLSATYTGSTSYAASTSTAHSYVIQALPTISANVPQQMSVGGVAQQFTVTVSNPSSGQSYPNAYLSLAIPSAGSITEPSTSDLPVFSYEDSAGNWCPLPYYTTGTNHGSMYYSGAGTPPCGLPPSSFSLAPGTTVSIPMEISFPAGGNAGALPFAISFYTGSCASQTSCTGATPYAAGIQLLSTSITVLPASGPGTGTAFVTDGETARPATTTVQQGFDVTLVANVTGAVGTYAFPSGTVQFFVDGQSAGTAEVSFSGTSSCREGCESRTVGSSGARPPLFYNTANLAPGTHTALMNYSGDQIYAPASLTETFTVVAGPPPGTPFTCDVANNEGGHPLPFSAYVTATALGIPSTTLSGTTVNASDTSVTLNLDGADYAYSSNLGSDQKAATINFSPSGTATAGPVTFSGTGTSLSGMGTWSGMSTSVPITGAPGSQVTIGVSSISFTFGLAGGTAQCTPVSDAAPIGTVAAAGNTLTASPANSATAGALVILTDTVYPSWVTTFNGTLVPNGQVDFYDGATDLGTVPVDYSGDAATGTASFTMAALSTGDHHLTAIWSGNGQVSANTSNTVDYGIGTAPTITTQPTDQSVSPNKTATFTASADGDPTPSVQWQVSTDGGATFTDIPGATNTSYTTPATMLIDNGNQYQAVFNNGVGGNVVTTPATLTVGFSPATTGYRLATSNGGVLAFGTDTNYGSVTGPLNAPIVGMASTPDGGGYWLVAADGGIFTFGDAGFYGSQGGKPLNAPIVGMASTPDGGGYWLVAADGGIFTFGDAGFYGSQGGKPLNAPIVGMDGTPDGQGYWLVASDGGIFTFGDATFSGSEGGSPLNAPITGMAATPDGGGYWLVAADGGIFTFGDATFNGSAAGQSSAPVVGMVPTSDGGGYWIGAEDGGIFTFGNAPFDGSGVGMANAPVVAITS